MTQVGELEQKAAERIVREIGDTARNTDLMIHHAAGHVAAATAPLKELLREWRRSDDGELSFIERRHLRKRTNEILKEEAK